MFLPRITGVRGLGRSWLVTQNKSDRSGHGVRLTLWNFSKAGPCHGQWRNWICVLSLLDLPAILDVNKSELIVNKFSSKVDPFVVPCLQEILNKNKNRQ